MDLDVEGGGDIDDARTFEFLGVERLGIVLPDDPDKRRLGFWLVQLVKVRA